MARRILVPVVVALMLYTLFIGWGLLFRWVRPENAYFLMALPCIAPIAWYGYGFVNITEGKQDFGLLLSAAGWALVALALLIRQTAINAAKAAAGGDAVQALTNTGNPVASTICALLALLFLVIGGALSYQAWKQQLSSGLGVQD